jgi:hypothetical protein
MAGMYPDNQVISLFGQELTWPGVDPDTGKFTNGDFNNLLVPPSYIPAETINLILDNLTALIAALGKTPNNAGTDQLLEIVSKSYLRERSGPGIICFSALNPVELARRRLLPLEGQVISVDLYQDLCQCVYAGDDNNATAPAFYRTEDSGGATRDITGPYMVLPDARGIFIRGAGQQSKTISWPDSQGNIHTVDTLYDGGSIGEFCPDTIRTLTGEGGRVVGSLGSLSGIFRGWGVGTDGGSGSQGSLRIAIDTSIQSPGGTNTAPGSTSGIMVISY